MNNNPQAFLYCLWVEALLNSANISRKNLPNLYCDFCVNLTGASTSILKARESDHLPQQD